MTLSCSSPDHGRRTWIVSQRLLFALLVASSIVMAGCPNGNRLKQGIRINELQPEASVFVDGHYVGKFAELQGRIIGVPPGKHLVEIRMPGFYNRYREVRVTKGKVSKLGVTLQKKLRWKEVRPKGRQPGDKATGKRRR